MTAFKLILPVLAMAALGGCVVTGGGPRESRDYALSGFDTIRAESGIDVVLSQGPFAVKAEAPEGRLDNIEIEQRGNELRVARKSEMVFFVGNMGKHVVHITAPSFTKVIAAGGADVESSGLQQEALELDASGGADIDFKGLRVTSLSAQVSGGGDIELAGSCTRASISAGGGGDFDGEALDCGEVTASASGGGDIDVRASVSATGTASGGGDVRFYGSAPQFTANESPGGHVSMEGR
jgi:hypothetical protein